MASKLSRKSPPPRPEPKPLAEWTIMVYLAGDNNLSAECVWALTEMQKGMRSYKPNDSSQTINLIAQFDPNDGLARTRRYEITEKGVIPKQARTSQIKPMEEDEPKPLDELAKDFAGWDAEAGEVLFGFESCMADELSGQRRKEKELQRRRTEKLIARGQPLTACLKPDESGASQNDTDAASPITLYNFLSYGVEFYPARHYMVVLSGHSAGVEPSYLLRDDSSGSYLSFVQLQAVFEQLKNDLARNPLKDGRRNKIDILGFDTCLMSMAEICCELKGHVDIVIGSETYTPSSGWPYQSILEGLCSSNSALDQTKTAPVRPAELARKIVDEYVQFYANYVTAGVSVALSALDVRKVPQLAPAVKKLATALTAELKAEHPELKGKPEKKRRPFTDALLLAHWDAQSYNGEWYVDLIDFCECLKSRYPKQTIAKACDGLIDFLGKHDGNDEVKDKFVIASEVSGPSYQYSYGVAIYFPWSSVARYFWDFDFADRSGWGDFLACYTNATRRKFRVPPNPTGDELELINTLEKKGGNFLNYARIAGRRASDKRASDKRASDKGLVFNKMTASDKRASDKMASDKRASDKRASDKMASETSGNPIHSMRNPPIMSLDFDF